MKKIDCKMLRAPLLACMVSVVLTASLLFVGCTDGGSQNSAGNTPATNPDGTIEKLVVGTMITEDFLPMWVAESEGIFKDEGIAVELVTFQSAQEMTTALVAGEVDMAMTDPMVAAKLTAAGTEVTLEWVTLGENAQQGRFGILASPASGVKTLQDLAGKPIGIASNTILEYVMDKLMASAGVPANQVVKEEIPKIPVRYEMMVSNQVAAAVLPASLLNLGEKTGMVLVADDTKGENLSQSVMIASKSLTSSSAGKKAVEQVKACWDKAATEINDSLKSAPETYRALLIEKASLPDPIAADYPISTYPLAKRPTSAMIAPILNWMLEKGYLETALSFDPASGSFVK